MSVENSKLKYICCRDMKMGFICSNKAITDICFYLESNEGIAYDVIRNLEYQVEYGNNYSGLFVKEITGIGPMLEELGYCEILDIDECNKLSEALKVFINDKKRYQDLIELMLIQQPELTDKNSFMDEIYVDENRQYIK